MNPTQIHSTYISILNLLSIGHLKSAFDKTKLLTNEILVGKYSDTLEEAEQNYRLLLGYFVKGIEDPERIIIFNKLIARLFTLNSEIYEELMRINSGSYEYTQMRYFPHTKHYNSAQELYISLNYYHSQSALIEQLENTHDVEKNRLRTNYETTLSELFKTYWLTSNYTSDHINTFNSIMQPSHTGLSEKTLLVSSLTINLLRRFDENKLMMLLDCCLIANQEVKQRALTGLCFVLTRHDKFIPYFPQIRNRLVLMADESSVMEYFFNIFIQIISTVETDKISKKLQEEILPEIMKISPLLKDKMEAENLLNSDDWDEGNPDWQDLLESSGVSDKLQELSKMQLEGADVYMSTFAMLKNFPFFNDISNWLLPFDTNHSSIHSLFANEDKSILFAFVGNNAMCNSDKYSFCLSISQMPEQQRSMLKQSFKFESEQLEEMSKDEAILNPNLLAKNISKQYIQDLFRLFKLHPQHGDFNNIFSLALSMHRSYLFNVLTENKDFKSGIAEYYFSKNHYREALELFEQIQKEEVPSAAIYQKLAYCYQHTSQLQNSLEAYLKADIIQPDDIWTIRKIALCYRLLGNYSKALEYYQHSDFLNPGHQNTVLQIGWCHVESGKFKEALAIYHQLDDKENDNVKVMRAIVWCAFVSGDFAQAEYYSQKVIELEAIAQDFINAGHIAWCLKKNAIAIDYYIQCLRSVDKNIEQFLNLMEKDKSYLLSNGIHADDFRLLLDELMYRNIENS